MPNSDRETRAPRGSRSRIATKMPEGSQVIATLAVMSVMLHLPPRDYRPNASDGTACDSETAQYDQPSANIWDGTVLWMEHNCFDLSMFLTEEQDKATTVNAVHGRMSAYQALVQMLGPQYKVVRRESDLDPGHILIYDVFN